MLYPTEIVGNINISICIPRVIVQNRQFVWASPVYICEYMFSKAYMGKKLQLYFILINDKIKCSTKCLVHEKQNLTNFLNVWFKMRCSSVPALCYIKMLVQMPINREAASRLGLNIYIIKVVTMCIFLSITLLFN